MDVPLQRVSVSENVLSQDFLRGCQVAGELDRISGLQSLVTAVRV